VAGELGALLDKEFFGQDLPKLHRERPGMQIASFSMSAKVGSRQLTCDGPGTHFATLHLYESGIKNYTRCD
jgi:hypothetical protein